MMKLSRQIFLRILSVIIIIRNILIFSLTLLTVTVFNLYFLYFSSYFRATKKEP